MDDADLLRYSRHLLLPEIDVDGQQRLLDASALVLGLGGLGSAAAMYLAASGVGRMVLADGDCVELSNLQRQVLHATPDVGRSKSASAAAAIRALNPGVQTVEVDERLDAAGLDRLVPTVSLVLDCSDNYATRYAVNRACFRHVRPLVSAAAVRWEGQLCVFDPGDAASPCYRCLYPDEDAQADQSCSANGIASPVVGTLGVLQALQVIKYLAGIGDRLIGELLVFDGLGMEWHRLRIPRRADCPVCSAVGRG